MPPIQELIHSLEVGAIGRSVRLIALLLGVITMAVVFNLREFQNFRSEEAMDAAQLAHNLAEGRGFSTRYVRPLSMGVMMRHNATHDPEIRKEHPDLVQAPLYPLMLAGFMKIPGLFDHDIVSAKEGQFRRHQPDFIIAFINQGLFFISIVLAWWLARKLFEDRVAFLTALMLLGSDLLWQFSASGHSTMLALTLFLILANVLVSLDEGAQRDPPRGGAWLAILAALAGLFCGGLLLTRYALGVVILPTLVYLAASFPGRRVVLPVVAAVAFLATGAPWIARNLQVCGAPFGIAPYSLIQETSKFTENWLERTMEPQIGDIGRDDILRKMFLGGADLVREDIPTIGGSWLTALFLAGLLIPFVHQGRTRFRWFTVGAILVLGVAQVLAHTHLSLDTPRINSENLLVLTAPLVFMFGAALISLLVFSLEVRVEAWRPIILGLVTVIMWLPLLITFGPPRSNPIAYPPYYPPTIQRVARWFEPGELIMSDMPWAVAWYGDRQSVLLSRNPDKEFLEINDWQKPVNGVHLSRLTLDQKFLTGWVLNAREWGRFIIEIISRGEVPKGFPLRKAPSFMTTFPDHILLADHERWQNTAPPIAPPRSLNSRKPDLKAPVPGDSPLAPTTTETLELKPKESTPSAKAKENP